MVFAVIVKEIRVDLISFVIFVIVYTVYNFEEFNVNKAVFSFLCYT